MGLLVGLPLGIFHLLFGLLLLLLRLAVPIAVIAVLVMLYRRGRSGQAGQPQREKPGEPKFNGPVYTVDYGEVDEEEGEM